MLVVQALIVGDVLDDLIGLIGQFLKALFQLGHLVLELFYLLLHVLAELLIHLGHGLVVHEDVVQQNEGLDVLEVFFQGL